MFISGHLAVAGLRGRAVNEDRWGERDEGPLIEASDLVVMVGQRGVRAVGGIVGHEGFVVIFPRIAFGQFHYPLVDRLAGRSVVTADVVAHDALVRRAVGSVLVGQGTLIDTDLTVESSYLPQEESRIRAKNRVVIFLILING